MADLSDLHELIELGDVDELVRHIDRLCANRDWAGLVDLRDQCRAALERGKQLWPASSHAEYRLALEADPAWAGPMLVEGTGRFTLGPLAEVAASTHTWDQLAPHVPDGPLRAVTAHECVVRGADLTGTDGIDTAVLDLPLRLEPWEPSYPVASYRAHEADFPSPPATPLEPTTLPPPGAQVSDPTVTDALLELVRPWVAESNGRAEAVAVEGGAEAAIAALGVRTAHTAPVTAAEALATMAWAGASGGAHGRRRGMAYGRFGAWWATAALAGLADEWPVTAAELGEAAEELRWVAWGAGEPPTGWTFRLAVEDPVDGMAWAASAVDAAT